MFILLAAQYTCWMQGCKIQGEVDLPRGNQEQGLAYVYLGHSPSHAGSVALVHNPRTGLISPQYHVVVDDVFSTVPSLREGTVPSNWEELVVNTREKSADGFYDITKTWFDADQSDPHV